LNPRTGKPFDFFLMDGKDWVNIIALTETKEVLLVEQLRHGINQTTIEIPGGCVEPHERDTPHLSALRELKEETGFHASQAEFLGSIAPNPAMQGMRLHCYVAFDVTEQAAQQLDAGEDIRIRREPLTEVYKKIRSGEVNHALVVAAFALFALRYGIPAEG